MFFCVLLVTLYHNLSCKTTFSPENYLVRKRVIFYRLLQESPFLCRNNFKKLLKRGKERGETRDDG